MKKSTQRRDEEHDTMIRGINSIREELIAQQARAEKDNERLANLIVGADVQGSRAERST